MNEVTTTILLLLTVSALLAALGWLAWPRRQRPAAARTIGSDVATGAAVLRGLGEQHAETFELRLRTLRPAPKTGSR